MKNTKILTAALAAMLIFAGCGNTSDSTESTVSSSVSTESKEEQNEVKAQDSTGSNAEDESTEPGEKAAEGTVKTTSYSREDKLIYVTTHDEHGNRISLDGKNGDYHIDYEYDSEDRLIKEVKTDGDGKEIYSETTTYDENGNILEYNCVGEGSDYDKSLIEKYTYDDHGNILTKDRTEDDKETDHDEYTYEYNADGTKASEIQKMHDGDYIELFYEYNADGTVAVMHSSDNAPTGNKMIETTTKYEYDANKNMIKSITYNDKGEEKEIQEYEYDEMGNVTRDRIEYVNDYFILKTFEYDDMGNETKRTQYDKRSEDKVDSYSTHEYDQYGNLLRYERYKNDKLDAYETYEYTYWND